MNTRTSEQIRLPYRSMTCWNIVLLLLLSGCSANDQPALVRVEGRVLLDGEPLESGSVITTPAQGRGSQGYVGIDGRFSLATRDAGEGAVVGVHRVAVVAYDNPEALQGNPEASVNLVVPNRYTSPDTSGLTIEVQQDGANEFTLELVSSER